MLFIFLSMVVTLAQNFTAFVSKNKVAVNETFQVSFKLENAQSRNVNFPSLEDFQVLGGPNTSTSMQFINGQTTQSVTYSFYLRPVKTGKFTIGPATVNINNKELTTQSIAIEVVNAGSSSGGNQTQASGQRQSGGTEKDQSLEKQLKEYIFLKALVSDREVYLGEQVTVTYKLYERIRAMNLVPDELPSYEGFWVENIELKGAPATNEVIDGIQYQTRVIKKDILIPQRSGKLRIDPMTLNCVVQVQAQPQRRRSIFDSFFNQYQNYQYTFANNPVTISVNALPTADKPASFTGMVGSFNLEVSLDKPQVETGDAITYRIKYTGKGNIKNISEPQLDFPPDFDVFDPKINESISKASGTISGFRSYDYLIVPRNPGEYKLPLVEFSYFDVSKGTYKTLTSQEYSVNVTGEAQRPEGTATNIRKEDMELIGQDIRFIKTSSSGFREKGSTFAGSIPFYLLYFSPLLLFAFVIFLRQKQLQAAGDVVGTRRKKASKMAQKRLSTAKKFMGEGNEKGFYNEVTRAVWGYLSDKLTINQSELSRENIREELLSREVDDALIGQLTDLLDTSEMALFAPSAATGGMQGTYEKALQIIEDLESKKV